MFKSIPGEAFLKWRKKMILIGGRKVDFDWLLDWSPESLGLNCKALF